SSSNGTPTHINVTYAILTICIPGNILLIMGSITHLRSKESIQFILISTTIGKYSFAPSTKPESFSYTTLT
ncbi:MAG: hypothetical protein J7578_18395, partial [Chitinophagaceae bacterium]|nr:hypothetical protein [Chitinophagaceae bacterium]